MRIIIINIVFVGGDNPSPEMTKPLTACHTGTLTTDVPWEVRQNNSRDDGVVGVAGSLALYR